MYYVICTILIIITAFIIKATHVKEYHIRCYSTGKEIMLTNEYNMELTIILFILILLSAFIPIFNIIIYGIFYIVYIIRLKNNPERVRTSEIVYVYSLTDSNIVSKSLKRVWKLLSTPI